MGGAVPVGDRYGSPTGLVRYLKISSVFFLSSLFLLFLLPFFHAHPNSDSFVSLVPFYSRQPPSIKLTQNKLV